MTNPKIQDAYYLLEISRVELENLIKSELQENPALELEDSPAAEKSLSEKKQTARSLVPDVRIHQNGNQFVVVLSDEGLRLRINPLYDRMAAQKIRIEGKIDYPFFIEKARAAKWLIKAIEQRQSTVLRVSEGIFRFQRELLQRGLNHIHPMTLRELADHIRLPESVITRAAANKWVETPHALFALDWFFAPPNKAKRPPR